MKIKEFNQNKEKFLCYCSKITYDKFEKELFSNNYTSLENLCDELNLAKYCAACLPNIEDEYFQLKGSKNEFRSIKFSKRKKSFKEKFKTLVDSFFGQKLLSLNGNLPMLVSKSIKTWLVVSNEKPSLMGQVNVPYKIEISIFDHKGNFIKKVSKLIQPNNKLKVCLNDYVSKIDNLKTYYAKVTRSAISSGFRGSTRPHFYYETNKSMATLHTQDGPRKVNFINIMLNNDNKDRNFIFIINPNSKTALVKSNVKEHNNGKIIKIFPKGSALQEIKKIKSLNSFLFKYTSTIPIKCYFIITDKFFQNISVDHM